MIYTRSANKKSVQKFAKKTKNAFKIFQPNCNALSILLPKLGSYAPVFLLFKMSSVLIACLWYRNKFTVLNF